MNGIAQKWIAFTPQFRSILRIATGILFILAGTSKILAFPVGMPPNGSTAVFGTQIWIGGMLELIGGALMIIGLFTRPTAFILSGEMAVAYFQFHAPQGFWPTVNGGVSAALFCFVFLYFSAAGAGPWSVDAMRGKG
jgi:putative oxidoreductase